MIVNDEFVRRYLPAGRIVGRRFANITSGDNGLVTEIVGVVGTTLKGGTTGSRSLKSTCGRAQCGASRVR